MPSPSYVSYKRDDKHKVIFLIEKNSIQLVIPNRENNMMKVTTEIVFSQQGAHFTIYISHGFLKMIEHEHGKKKE